MLRCDLHVHTTASDGFFRRRTWYLWPAVPGCR